MFGNRYFGKCYYGDPYWGPGVATPIPAPTVTTGLVFGRPRRKVDKPKKAAGLNRNRHDVDIAVALMLATEDLW